ncbi:hypothetical protein J1N35_027901 [Gossypium stocksii]|uniref:Calcineurin-like phosphoesterase domain-containing protein n=1 Tax=Gossypium stocksii TaxID=47602 RepID=A0A9D4A0M8_9ROSI|nr:hypothetical protein J1N35_027901 [Gossypium stocksii]
MRGVTLSQPNIPGFCMSSSLQSGELERVHLKAQPRNGNSSKGDGFLGFLVVGEWGRKGAFNPSRVAFQMGKIGEKLKIDFVVSTGDNFYDNGLNSQHDPAFLQSLQIQEPANPLVQRFVTFYLLGNHDYRGDAAAQSSPFLRQIDSRWFCLRSFIVNAELAEIIFVDNTPLVKSYFLNSDNHTYDWHGIIPRKRYITNLLKDVECALRESIAKWKIVVGHHAIRSIGFHSDTEELVNYLLPILKANNVDFYINGHDHCLQHISDTDSRIEFLTSGAGSKAWRGDMKKQRREGLRFFYDGHLFNCPNLMPTLPFMMLTAPFCILGMRGNPFFTHPCS